MLEHGGVSPGFRPPQVSHTCILPVLWEGGLDAKRFLSRGLWLCPITQNTWGLRGQMRGLSRHPLAAARLPGLGVGSGSCGKPRLGVYFCAGAAQEAPPGEESIHPAAETSSTAIFLVKHKAKWKGAGGRRQISIGRSCALPRAFVPGAMRSQGTPGPARGQWGHPWDTPPPWEGGRSVGGCLHPNPLPGCRGVMLLMWRDAACGPAGDVPFCILE